jgi:hypothetical protein
LGTTAKKGCTSNTGIFSDFKNSQVGKGGEMQRQISYAPLAAVHD